MPDVTVNDPIPVYPGVPPAALTVIIPVPPFIVIGEVTAAFATRAPGSLTV